jgi:hypothetical protein
METITRNIGGPYTYRNGDGQYFWTHPGNPVVHGPFLTHNDALDDIVAFNVAQADRIIAIARTAHEVNRVFCEFVGDFSQPRFEDAPAWQRTSAIKGVEFHLANRDAGDSASHDSWMAEKVATGWVYGEVKDPDAVPPTHPCMVPFDQLPPEQQIKDRFFRTIVHAAAGL